MKQAPLLSILHHAIDSVRPSRLLPAMLQEDGQEVRGWKSAKKKSLLCIGKASLNAGEALLRIYPKLDHFLLAAEDPGFHPTRATNIHFGSHPLPDEKSYSAARNLISWLESQEPDSSLLVILSGGASALMVYPAEKISLAAKIQVNDLLIRSGASIQEMNTVRKHLSRVKGGQLAQFCRKQNTTVLVISDVIGDDLSTIGSGPFYPDPSRFRDAKAVLEKYDLWNSVHAEIRGHIENGLRGKAPETLKETSAAIPHFVIASNKIARQAAIEKALEMSYQIVTIEKPLSGLIQHSAARLAERLMQLGRGAVLIAGGEVTVEWKGTGRGGRNQHLALLLTSALAGTDIFFAAAGTDGIDGNSPAAGAWTSGATAEKARRMKLSLQEFTTNFNSYAFFDQIGQSIEIGPTGTNVMDLYLGIR